MWTVTLTWVTVCSAVCTEHAGYVRYAQSTHHVSCVQGMLSVEPQRAGPPTTVHLRQAVGVLLWEPCEPAGQVPFTDRHHAGPGIQALPRRQPAHSTHAEAMAQKGFQATGFRKAH